MELTVETITPDQARVYLNSNVSNNRTISDGSVDMYVRDMLSGNWALNGEAIKFNSSGQLIDGQHRLSAIVRAGIPITTAVVRGVNSIDGIDRGKVRNIGDVLEMNGVLDKASKTVAVSIIRTHKAFSNGKITRAFQGLGKNAQFSTAELAEYVALNPQLIRSVPTIDALRRKGLKGIPSGVIGTVYDQAVKIDVEAADTFFNDLKNGVRTGLNDPLNTLSERIISDRINRRAIHPGTGMYYLARTWNAYRDGESLTKMQIGTPENPSQIPLMH